MTRSDLQADLHNSPITQAKRAFRALMVEVRRQASFHLGAVAAHELAQMAGDLGARPGQVVAGYWPMGDELDVLPLLARLHQMGCPLALPVVRGDDQPLIFRAYQPGQELETGALRTRQPGPDQPQLIPDLLLVPLLAYDSQRFRLGYGRGFYDRTLQDLRARKAVRTIGVAFSAQEVDAVPREDHDQRLDAVLTELGLNPAVSA